MDILEFSATFQGKKPQQLCIYFKSRTANLEKISQRNIATSKLGLPT